MMYEGQRRPDLWNVAGWVAVGLAGFCLIVGVAGLSVAVLARWPVAAGLVVSHAAAVALGLWLRSERIRRLAFVAHFLGEEVEAVHIADRDEDIARYRAERTSGQQPAVARTVELYDQDALAELRTEANAIDLNRWVDGISADPTVEHLGQACGWSDDGTTDCGDPAEGWATWPDGEVVWLCGIHFQWVRETADEPDGLRPESLPRVLPEGRISD